MARLDEITTLEKAYKNYLEATSELGAKITDLKEGAILK